MWRLKPDQPAFEMVDGPLAGTQFHPGVVYGSIPQGVADRFEPVTPTTGESMNENEPIEEKADAKQPS